MAENDAHNRRGLPASCSIKFSQYRISFCLSTAYICRRRLVQAGLYGRPICMYDGVNSGRHHMVGLAREPMTNTSFYFLAGRCESSLVIKQIMPTHEC